MSLFIYLNLAWIDDTGIESMSKTPVEVPSLKGTNYESVLDEEKAKTSVDLINTLYVALTRAKQTLNVYTTTKDGEIIPVPLRFVQNWEEWNEKSSSLILK
jgi:ATP-dependent exoDNAse (exonuclease V) beta subunit